MLPSIMPVMGTSCMALYHGSAWITSIVVMCFLAYKKRFATEGYFLDPALRDDMGSRGSGRYFGDLTGLHAGFRTAAARQQGCHGGERAAAMSGLFPSVIGVEGLTGPGGGLQ